MQNNIDKCKAFSDLLATTTGTDLIKEKFNDLIAIIKELKEGLEESKLFSDLLTAIKGTPLVNEKFFDLLTVFESWPDDEDSLVAPYALRKAFSALISSISETNLIKEKFVDLLTLIKNWKLDWKKRVAFSELVFAIKGTSLMKERFTDLLDIVENMPNVFSKYIAFSNLLIANKKSLLIAEFYNRIKKVFSKLLTEVVEPSNDIVANNGLFPAFSALADSIKESHLMREKFNDLMNMVENWKDLDGKRDVFLHLLGLIKETDLIRVKFTDLLTIIKNWPDDRQKYHIFGILIGSIKEAELINEFYIHIKPIYSELLNGVKRWANEEEKLSIFSELLAMIKQTDLMKDNFTDFVFVIENCKEGWEKYEMFSILLSAINEAKLRENFTDLMSIIENWKDSWDKCVAFSDLFVVIEKNELLEDFYYQIEETFSKVLTWGKHMPDSDEKQETLSILLDLIKRIDLVRNKSTDLQEYDPSKQLSNLAQDRRKVEDGADYICCKCNGLIDQLYQDVHCNSYCEKCYEECTFCCGICNEVVPIEDLAGEFGDEPICRECLIEAKSIGSIENDREEE
ncbi:MAG: hypothetical protein ACFFFB_12675 [Candidatus Heimdallarchaeota archaeon]